MELTVGTSSYRGEAVDLREEPVDRDALIAGIYGDDSPYDCVCQAPGPVHVRAGVVTPEMGLRSRTALAAAARSRGIDASADERIETIADELAALAAGIAEDDTAAPAGPSAGELGQLRERTAELRGQISALDGIDADPSGARRQLREAATTLSELETERIAAKQRQERLRERRDRRERRLKLEDRLANARRDARRALVAAVREEYVAAVTDLGADREDPFAAPAHHAALAVLRVANVAAPVVLAVDAFEGPDAAADWLDAPVVSL